MSLLASICRPNGDTGSGECRWASEEAIWTILKANWTQEVRALPAELDACAHTDGAPMRGKSLICQVSSSRLQMSTLRLQSTPHAEREANRCCTRCSVKLGYPAVARGCLALYYGVAALQWLTCGEVSELAEGARLEIVYAPKAYPGFKSPPLRQTIPASR